MNLPVEILSLIFTFISDQQSLVLLLHTSRLFKTLAEPLFYRNISFLDLTYFLSSRIHKFKQRIDEEPRLAKYVASYATLVPDEVSAILPKLINIRRLKLGYLTSEVDFNNLHQSFSRLTHLICNTAFDDTDPFWRFLESQSSLELLNLSHDFLPVLTLSTDSLPRLHTLSAGIRTARSILPGRNIRHLAIVGKVGLHGLIDFIPGHTFPSVQSLLGESSAGGTRVIQQIASLFPNLKYLAFNCYCFSPVERFPQNHIIDCLRQLVVIKIEYISFTISAPCFMQCRDEVASVRDLQTHLKEFPSLRALYLEYANQPFYQQDYRPFRVLRYHSGNSSPVEMYIPRIDFEDWESWWEIRDLAKNSDQVRTQVVLQGPSVASRSRVGS